jgi:hypothetical protein
MPRSRRPAWVGACPVSGEGIWSLQDRKTGSARNDARNRAFAGPFRLSRALPVFRISGRNRWPEGTWDPLGCAVAGCAEEKNGVKSPMSGLGLGFRLPVPSAGRVLS